MSGGPPWWADAPAGRPRPGSRWAVDPRTPGDGGARGRCGPDARLDEAIRNRRRTAGARSAGGGVARADAVVVVGTPTGGADQVAGGELVNAGGRHPGPPRWRVRRQAPCPVHRRHPLLPRPRRHARRRRHRGTQVAATGNTAAETRRAGRATWSPAGDRKRQPVPGSDRRRYKGGHDLAWSPCPCGGSASSARFWRRRAARRSATDPASAALPRTPHPVVPRREDRASALPPRRHGAAVYSMPASGGSGGSPAAVAGRRPSPRRPLDGTPARRPPKGRGDQGSGRQTVESPARMR